MQERVFPRSGRGQTFGLQFKEEEIQRPGTPFVRSLWLSALSVSLEEISHKAIDSGSPLRFFRCIKFVFGPLPKEGVDRIAGTHGPARAHGLHRPDQLLKDYEKPSDLLEKDGLLDQLKKAVYVVPFRSRGVVRDAQYAILVT